MTQDETKAGVWVIPKPFLYNAYDEDDLQMVADAAAKAEREACAKVCEGLAEDLVEKSCDSEAFGAERSAAAIRSMK